MGFNHDWGGNSGAAGGPPLRKAHLTNETLWSLTSHTDHSGLLHNTCGAGSAFFADFDICRPNIFLQIKWLNSFICFLDLVAQSSTPL